MEGLRSSQCREGGTRAPCGGALQSTLPWRRQQVWGTRCSGVHQQGNRGDSRRKGSARRSPPTARRTALVRVRSSASASTSQGSTGPHLDSSSGRLMSADVRVHPTAMSACPLACQARLWCSSATRGMRWQLVRPGIRREAPGVQEFVGKAIEGIQEARVSSSTSASTSQGSTGPHLGSSSGHLVSADARVHTTPTFACPPACKAQP